MALMHTHRHGLETIAFILVFTVSTLSEAKPRARNDNASTFANVSVLIPVLQNDKGSNISIEEILPGSERRGRALISADGKNIIFIPETNYVGDRGQFTYRISDKSGTDTARVNITVQQTPQNPDDDSNIIDTPTPTDPIDKVIPYLNLAQEPLEQSLAVEPNVLVIGDDSGSMDFDMMINGEGVFTEPGTSSSSTIYSYVLPFDNLFKSGSLSYIVPSESAAQIINPNLARILGLWRARNHEFNKIYYNPQIQYTPWVGKNLNDQPYLDSDPFRAPTDPNDLTERVDLSQTISFSARLPSGQRFTVINYYVPRYYQWLDSNGNQIVDPDDVHQLVQILPNQTYPGGPDRDDCTTLPDAPFRCSYAEEIKNFANWFTYYRRRQYILKAALGQTLQITDGLRIGYTTLNSTSTRTPIKSLNFSLDQGNKKELLSTIYRTGAVGSTPLRSALDKAGRYFSCSSGNSFDTSKSNPGDTNCPILASPAGQCQQNYTVLFSDGARNGSSVNVGNADGNNNSLFDGGAFADPFSNTLADIAMHYYERDLFSSLSNDVPPTLQELDLVNSKFLGDSPTLHQHMTTYTVGFGVDGVLSDEDEPTDFNQSFFWPNPDDGTQEKTDDLRHAAYNGRGRYLSSTNPVALAKDFRRIFNEVRRSLGASSSIAFSVNQLKDETLLISAFYQLGSNAGDLIASRFDSSKAPRVTTEEAWSASERLDAKSPDERVIISYDPNSFPRQGISFRYDQLNEFHKSQLDEDQVNYLRGQRQLEEPKGRFRERPASRGILGDIVNSTPILVETPIYTRRNQGAYPQIPGKTYHDFRIRYADRPAIVYIGANDGMLHGFHAQDNPLLSAKAGDELFAYIPDRLINGNTSSNDVPMLSTASNLQTLTDPLYSHSFFVNQTPAINDVFITPNRLARPGSDDKQWATVLVGALGGGGRGLFALNITEPKLFIDEQQAAKQVLWEFSDDDDADLGFSLSDPILTMSNLQEDGVHLWLALFGNGINSDTNSTVLFGLIIDKGIDGDWSSSDYIKIDTQTNPVLIDESGQEIIQANGLGTPRAVDVNADGTVDYIYAGDHLGHLYRFDLQSSDRSQWRVEKIFTASIQQNGINKRQPLTNKPIIIRHPEQDGLIVLVGSGRFISDGNEGDKANTNTQSIYGIWDTLKPGHQVSRQDLQVQQYSNIRDPEFGNIRVLSDHAMDWSQKKGWYIDLDIIKEGAINQVEFPGERAIRNFQIRNNIAFVNTVIPKKANNCALQPGGFGLAFNPETGGRLKDNPVALFDLNNDGKFNEQDQVNGLVVMGYRFNNAIPADSRFYKGQRFTQLSNRDLHVYGVNLGDDPTLGRFGWAEIDEDTVLKLNQK